MDEDRDYIEGELIRQAASDAWEMIADNPTAHPACSKFVRAGKRVWRVEVRLVDSVGEEPE